jgi:Ser/Thr protein kinase RdoA (MazF antagonist)
MAIELAGLRRIGQGRAAEIFALDAERVIKVARPGAGESLEREAEALRAAYAASMPVPAPHELMEIGGRRALVMGRAPGTDMLTALARQPWTLLRAGARFGRLHARIHDRRAPATLPSARDVMARRLADSREVPPAPRERALAMLRELPEGDRLCHFDFHPGNVITDGKQLTIIDWPGACRADPLADVAATIVILRGGKTGPGTPLITRLFAPLGRKLMLAGYRRGYRSQGAIDEDRLGRWLFVLACVRLTYRIAGEEALLLATLEKGISR